MGSQESLASYGASSVASSRICTPKIVRKPNINLSIGNSYNQTIKTLQDSLKEKESHLEKVLREREADLMEIARLTGLKCMSPSPMGSNVSEDRVKELEAEVNRLTNELLEKTKELEELTFTLEEERAVTQERMGELQAQISELKKKESIEVDIPEVMTPAETDSEASSHKGSKKQKDKKKRKNSGLFTGLSMVMFRDFTFAKV
uniref:Calponin-homology (CH) domain-containing protein n=1 Tax=Steinernema glaseri TaxID=37863 RepID=A0A1I7YN22_9BILA